MLCYAMLCSVVLLRNVLLCFVLCFVTDAMLRYVTLFSSSILQRKATFGRVPPFFDARCV